MKSKFFLEGMALIVCLLMLSIPSIQAQEIDYCEGNFDCDGDVDGTDAALFKSDFGRSDFQKPCPSCYIDIPKTGQTTSYATGDDGDLEMGFEPIPNPRFTEDRGTVTDHLTRLIWMRDANCFGSRTWNDALSDCNGLASGSCGLTDGSSAGEWRLPNSNELASLVHKGYIEPAIPNTTGTGQWTQGDPFTNVQLWYYWSSTVFAAFSGIAWHVDMVDGHVYHYDKTSTYHVWCVRGGQ